MNLRDNLVRGRFGGGRQASSGTAAGSTADQSRLAVVSWQRRWQADESSWNDKSFRRRGRATARQKWKHNGHEQRAGENGGPRSLWAWKLRTRKMRNPDQTRIARSRERNAASMIAAIII